MDQARRCRAIRPRSITALPLYHIFALTANCLLFVVLGWRNVLITNPRSGRICPQHGHRQLQSVARRARDCSVTSLDVLQLTAQLQ